MEIYGFDVCGVPPESADFPDIGYLIDRCGEMDEQQNNTKHVIFYLQLWHSFIPIWINFRFAFANYGGYIYIYKWILVNICKYPDSI
jgi:hypothetical protein